MTIVRPRDRSARADVPNAVDLHEFVRVGDFETVENIDDGFGFIPADKDRGKRMRNPEIETPQDVQPALYVGLQFPEFDLVLRHRENGAAALDRITVGARITKVRLIGRDDRL